jgi:choline dehydrogenase-like flavoprotein
MQGTAYDAIVVGSGISGGWAAMELCRNGLKTLCLEAGRPIDPETDYVEHTQSWELPFRGRGDRRRVERTQPVQKLCYACDEWSGKFFVNDLENPYTYPADKPFRWIRGRQVGGRSITWNRQVYRWSDLDFEANARDGHGVDWPVRYADIAPWYEHVERFIGVTGLAEGLSHLPDGIFQPPMGFRCAEQHIRDRLRAAYRGDRVLTIGRAAILTRPLNGRRACHYCGPCERGCRTLSYFSSVNATLPAARQTGNLTLRPFSVVESVLYDRRTGRARGVRVIDATTRQTLEFGARVVFLCASALESVRILLNSREGGWPNGLANSSGTLGRYVMDHTMGIGAEADLAGYDDRVETGNRPTGIYLARFRNVKEQHPGFVRGYAFQGGATRAGWARGESMPGFGAEFKRELIGRRGPWRMRLHGFGECLPREDNFVELDPTVRDAWGIPVLRISVTWGANERAQQRDMAATAVEMLEAAGLHNIEPFDNPHVHPGLVIHEMGGARMGRDPRTSVTNQWNQAWDVPNLFLTDGAFMTSSANQNPSITYMAFTARAVDHAVDALKRREL